MTVVGRFDALGATVELRTPRSIAALLREVLADLAVDRPATTRVEFGRNLARRRWSVRTDGVRDTFVGTTDLAFYEAIGVVSDLAARAAATDDVVLHASCIDIAGTAVAFTGPSGAGKSTLAAALALGGHAYLADEVTAIGVDDMVVQPFHRPVGLRHAGAASLDIEIPDGPYEYTFPVRLGARSALSDGAPLGAVFVLRRDDGDARCAAIDPAHALFQLANLTLGSSGHERPMFRRLETLVHSVPTYELTSNDVAAAMALVEDVVSERRS